MVLSSLPARGAWIEIPKIVAHSAQLWASLPARGAWIEIFLEKRFSPRGQASLPARGAWIEMFLCSAFTHLPKSRSPHGERGLKFLPGHGRALPAGVAPRTGSVD